MSTPVKKIEDYLHYYYMGLCEEAIIVPGQDALFVPGIISVRTIYNVAAKLSIVKPILRPLSDMTKEEAEYFAWICMDSKNRLDSESRIAQEEIDIELVFNDDGLMLDNDIEVYIGVTCRCFEGAVILRKDGSICVEDDEGVKQEPIDNIAEKVHYLLSKGFDLFGLIEAGLAIDKTTLK